MHHLRNTFRLIKNFCTGNTMSDNKTNGDSLIKAKIIDNDEIHNISVKHQIIYKLLLDENGDIRIINLKNTFFSRSTSPKLGSNYSSESSVKLTNEGNIKLDKPNDSIVPESFSQKLDEIKQEFLYYTSETEKKDEITEKFTKVQHNLG